MFIRLYSIFLGIALIVALLLESESMLYAIIAICSVEAVADVNFGRYLDRVLLGEVSGHEESGFRFRITAEQMQRFVIVVFLYITCFLYPQEAWFGPWFLSLVLIATGITSVCPAILFFRWAGFR